MAKVCQISIYGVPEIIGECFILLHHYLDVMCLNQFELVCLCFRYTCICVNVTPSSETSGALLIGA